MDAIIICVPTPLNEYHEPDISYITDTADAIAPHLRAGQLVILESTTYPGTTEEVLVPILEKGNRLGVESGAQEGAADDKEFYVAFSPEREDPGNTSVARQRYPQGDWRTGYAGLGIGGRAVWLDIQPHRAGIVSGGGGDDQAAGEHLSLREHCAGQRVEDVLAAHGNRHLGSHRRGLDQAIRIPSVLSRARPGRTLHSGRSFLSFLEGERVGLPYSLYRTGGRDQQQHAVSRAGSHEAALNQQKKAVNGSKVLVLGVAYKRDIDDLRESPALTIIELLQKEGAQVSYNDPTSRPSAKDANTTCR